jgi:putative oxidoreductase
MTGLDLLQNGLGASASTLALNRLVLGAFFSISGFHKLFNRQRHASVTSELKSLGIPALWFNQWWVPTVEFTGGLALISGVLAPLAAMGLMVICLVATCTAGVKRIPSYKPIDWADWLDDLLYLPEVLYLIGLSIIISFGPGQFTLVSIIQHVWG